jgi:hypothetical protein
MILTTAAFLTFVGLGVFVLGAVFGQREVAVIGATLVLGVGAMTTLGGLEVRSGDRVVETSNNTTVTEFQYRQVETPTRLPLGALMMLLGSTLAIRGVNDVGGGSV